LHSFKLRPGPGFIPFAFAALVAAQGQQPAPAASAPAPPSKSAVTLHAGTQLVVVDVVVTGKDRKPVHGLKQSDFALTEDNAPQTLNHFEEHIALTAADATKFAPMPKLPAGVFTNYTPDPVGGAVDVLLIDALNTPVKDQLFVRQQLLAYLNSASSGARIAIFGLTSRLTILQGFTSDPAVLKAVASKKFGKSSPLLQDAVGGNGIQNSVADDMEDAGMPADTVANVRQFEAETQSYQTQLRVKYTLDAMSQLARYLSSIPGRKNLIWFSGSFPISIFPDSTLTNPFSVVADSSDQFRDAVNLLARSQVAVYPVDARGLFNSSVFDAATTRNYTSQAAQRAGQPSRMQQDLNKFNNDTAAEHSTMSQMAEGTGGRAFYNTNGLTQAVAEAINDGSNFYTLTYTPGNTARNGEFRKIKVQLARQGFNLAYRHGYYADDPAKGPLPAKGQPKSSTGVTDAAVTAAATTVQQNMRVAMMRGSPTPSEILMKVAVYPAGAVGETEDKPVAGNILSEKTRGPFHRYSVNYAIDPTGITFLRTADGKIHADFELVIFVFDPDGVLVNRLATTLHIASTLEEIRKNVAHGIQYGQGISAPVKGEYFLRIAVHDLNRDHYGVVEVATSDVKGLTPVAAQPSASSPTAAPAEAPAPAAPK
jgi:VWFA-related protein